MKHSLPQYEGYSVVIDQMICRELTIFEWTSLFYTNQAYLHTRRIKLPSTYPRTVYYVGLSRPLLACIRRSGIDVGLRLQRESLQSNIGLARYSTVD